MALYQKLYASIVKERESHEPAKGRRYNYLLDRYRVSNYCLIVSKTDVKKKSSDTPKNINKIRRLLPIVLLYE